jgi:hypothetical protein
MSSADYVDFRGFAINVGAGTPFSPLSLFSPVVVSSVAFHFARVK